MADTDWSSLSDPHVAEDSGASRYAVPEPPCASEKHDDAAIEGSGEQPAAMPVIDYLIAAVIGAVATVAVALTWSGYGHSWDEAYYYEPARKTQDWMLDMAVSNDKPVGREAIGEYWSEAKELPALPKFAWATGLALFEGLLGSSYAMRAPAAVAFGLLLMLVYRVGHALGGRWSALAASLLMAGMPRAWAEAHLAVAETFAALMFLMTVYCFWRGLFSTMWAIGCGIVFGFALNTKIQAILLPVILIPWDLYVRPRRPKNAIALLLLSPLVWIATWPWLWHDPFGRIFGFLQFYAHHATTAVYYLGMKWNYGKSPLCPWHYSWVMTAITMPPPALVAVLAGMGMAVRHHRSRPAPVLIGACGLVPIAFNSLPFELKYDGVRLFGWAFPFLAILGGGALGAMVGRYGFSVVTQDDGATRRGARHGWAWYVYGASLLWGLLAVAFSNPHSLSYFNGFIGGVAGAERRGMEVAYWGESVNKGVLDYLNKELPKDARLKTRALHDLALIHQQEWGALRADIRIDGEGGPESFDYHLIQNRRGMWGQFDNALYQEYSEKYPDRVKTWDYDGVPVLYLFDTRSRQ